MSWPDRQQVRSSWSVSDCAGTGDAAAGRTLTQNALVERSGRLSSHCHVRHDKTVVTMCMITSIIINVNVNVEFKVTLHEQVRYRDTLAY